MSAWPQGYRRRVLQSVESTLDEARRLAPDVPGATWILAEEQTAARGRRGRAWTAPPGNFAATLLLHPQEPPGKAALRSFVMSLAVLRSCASLCGSENGFALKWPNDVLLNGGKLAGILLESAGQGRGLAHLAIGVGVNLLAAPPPDQVEAGALRPVALASETGMRIAPEVFLDTLAEQYAGLEQQFVTFGFAPIRTAWMRHAARIGEIITARTSTAETTGTFEDVDATGNLILHSARGPIAIAAADVFF